jgi:hypothetical protein
MVLRKSRMNKHHPPRARLRFEHLEARLLLHASVIEDFGGGLSAYQGIYRYYPAADVVPGAAHDGVGNALVKHDGSEWMIRDDDPVQVHAGETISVWTKFAGAVDGRIYFGFGATPDGPVHSPLKDGGTLALVLAGNTGQFMFMANDPAGPDRPEQYGFQRGPVPIGQAATQDYVADQWYRLKVIWGTDGSLTGKLYDDQGNLLKTVAARDTIITSGGIAFRGFGSDKYFDTVTVSRHAHAGPPLHRAADVVPSRPPPGPGPGLLVTSWDGGTGTVLPFDYVSVAGTGRDIALSTFDQLQQAHNPIGGMVGLAAANTSANVGDVQVSWGRDPLDNVVYHDVPNEAPLLSQYLFRQRPGEPTTLIGSSDVKRFYSSTHTDAEFLNPGEQDTYVNNANSAQTRYLPGADLNPVTGDIPRPSYYSYVNQDGFDIYQAPTFANNIEHLLKVNVSDLDPAQNPADTRWFLAGNLWVTGDDDVSDNSRWVEITPAWNPATQRFSFMYPDGAGGQFDLRTLPNLSTAPYLVRATPAGELLTAAVDTVSVTFDRPIDPGTFTPSQVQFTGPDGPIAVDAITPVDDRGTRFNMTFAAQGDDGPYSLVLGTGIADVNGTRLDVARTIRFDIQGVGAPGLPLRARGSATRRAEAAVMTAAPPMTHRATVASFGWSSALRRSGESRLKAQLQPARYDPSRNAPPSDPALALPDQLPDTALTDIAVDMADMLLS